MKSQLRHPSKSNDAHEDKMRAPTMSKKYAERDSSDQSSRQISERHQQSNFTSDNDYNNDSKNHKAGAKQNHKFHSVDIDSRHNDHLRSICQRNAIYAKRKYYKKKRHVEHLQTTKYQLEINNQRLRIDNEKLELILNEAKKVVRTTIVATETYTTIDIPRCNLPVGTSTTGRPTTTGNVQDQVPSDILSLANLTGPSWSELMNRSVPSVATLESLKADSADILMSLQHEAGQPPEYFKLNCNSDASNRQLRRFLSNEVNGSNGFFDITSSRPNSTLAFPAESSPLLSFISQNSNQNNMYNSISGSPATNTNLLRNNFTADSFSTFHQITLPQRHPRDIYPTLPTANLDNQFSKLIWLRRQEELFKQLALRPTTQQIITPYSHDDILTRSYLLSLMSPNQELSHRR